METLPQKSLVQGAIIADDHPSIVEILRNYLQENHIADNYHTAANGIEAFQCMQTNNCAIAFLDYLMPKMDGFLCAKKIKELNPFTKIICFSGFTEKEIVKEAFKSGVDAFVSKTQRFNALLEAIIAVLQGKKYVSDDIKTTVAEDELFHVIDIPANHKPPTTKQIEVVALLAKGSSYKEIADHQKIEECSVRSFLTRAYKKYNVDNSRQLVDLFRTMGYIK